MAIPNTAIYKNKMRGTVYVLNFIFALQMATVSYFGANYLKFLGLDTRYISFVYALASAVAALSFFASSHIFNKFGAYRSVFFVAILYVLSYIVQALSNDISLVLPVFILNSGFAAIIVAALDALMERFTSSEQETGGQRGIFLTMASAAFVAGPFLGGLLVKGDDFKSLWLAAAAIFFPFLIISFWKLKKIERIKYKQFHLRRTVSSILNNKDVFNVFWAQFILYFFYSIMVIYTSVYLKEEMGLAYDKIGLIFAFMLVPFVVFTVPLGKIADKKLGEQELMMSGFIISAVSTLAFALNNSNSAWLVATLLFFTRVGASFIQTMTETYFFKLVDGKDTDLIGAFRALYPISSIVAPLLASPILFLADFKALYIFLSLVTLSGLYFSAKITDTK